MPYLYYHGLRQRAKKFSYIQFFFQYVSLNIELWKKRYMYFRLSLAHWMIILGNENTFTLGSTCFLYHFCSIFYSLWYLPLKKHNVKEHNVMLKPIHTALKNQLKHRPSLHWKECWTKTSTTKTKVLKFNNFILLFSFFDNP